MSKHHQVIILGSGPSGLTAAVYTSRANLSPLLIHGPIPGGQLTTTTDVENFPGFPEGVMGPDLMTQMEMQAKRFGTEFVVDYVTKVDLKAKPISLQTGNETYTCDALIIATGAISRLLGLESEKELMGFGVSTCATCDGAFYREKVVIINGGGDSACEEAVFLTKFAKKVYLVHRRDELRASKIMADRVMNHEKIEVLWSQNIKEIHGTKQTGVTGVTLIHSQTEEETTVDCDGIFIAIGHKPTTDLFVDQLDLDQGGYVKTKPDSTATNIPGVFACGDVQDHVFRQAITAAGSGCMAAIEAERFLES